MMKRKGFTLIELLIVVTIIGILAVALVPRIIGGSAAARDARRKTDVQTIVTGLEYYLSENGSFSGITVATAGAKVCSTSTVLATALASSIGQLPSDPKSTTSNGAFGAIGCADYVIYFMEESDTNATVTKYAVVAALESTDTGGDFTYGLPVAVTGSEYTSIGATTFPTYSTGQAYYAVY
ncbi:MAG: type II secretion system protein [Candidatus Gracilibacteria bacterium]|jgi:prepilin-type N-terminal cleavage/methylation domain-containing protein